MSALTVEVSTREFLRMLAEVEPFACRDPLLPIVNCIHLEAEPGQLAAIATDKYSLGGSRLELEALKGTAEGSISLLDAKQLARAFKPAPKTDPSLDLTFTDTELIVETSGGITGFPTLRMSVARVARATPFPDYRKLFAVPTPAAEAPSAPQVVGFNPVFMARFVRAQRWQEPMVITYGIGHRPTLVHIGDHFVGLIMPLRLNGNDAGKRWMVEPRPVAEPPASKPAAPKRAAKAAPRRKRSAA